MKLLSGVMLFLLAASAAPTAQSVPLNCPYGRAIVAVCKYDASSPRMPTAPKGVCPSAADLPDGSSCTCGENAGKIVHQEGLACNPAPPEKAADPNSECKVDAYGNKNCKPKRVN